MRPHVLAIWLSAGVPFIAYVFTASGFAYWLDSGEFVSAALYMDIAHPPGHPLSGLWGRAFCAWPLGSLSFRVALGQACASALASALQCRATAFALRGLGLDARIEWSLATFGAWTSAFTYALWFQAVRPEVYALQTLCVAAICERLLADVTDVAGQDKHGRSWACAAAILGLALCNHHLIGFLLVPAFVPGLVTRVLRRNWRALAAAFGLGAIGLATYLYLPLRAAHALPANFGDPRDLARFWWVISARVYAHDMGSEAVQPLATRLLDVVALWHDDVSWPVLLMAAVGLYAGLRTPAIRSGVLILGHVGLVDGFARAWLGPVRANPDILGYLAPSFLAIGSLAACFLGVTWQLVPRVLSWRWALAAPGVALLAISSTWSQASLAEFTATDDLDDLRLRELPARAVVAWSSPQAVFRALELAAVEVARPDLTALPLPFLRYPGTSEALIARERLVQSSVEGYLAAHDHLALPPLIELARKRPVLIELDTRVDPPLYPFLLTRGTLTQLSPAPRRVERKTIADMLARTHEQLSSRLGAQRQETETARQLLWIHYMNAIQLGALGQRDLALSELARARSAHPEEQRLGELERALREPAPLDPTSFLRF